MNQKAPDPIHQKLIFPILIAALLRSAFVFAADPKTSQHPSDFTELSLEELMNIKVVSVTRKSEKLSESPAAVFVITGEEIRRSGATSIPEALRLAPGIEVGRINAHTWAITSRGFNDEFANKLLVMIDGRTIYTPLFSGVFWDVQDANLDDIDRIEVIRGPGATSWGANAVNGVINIITKNAKETTGALITAGGGSEERGFGSIRYGAKGGRNFYYRAYAKYFNRSDFPLPDGTDAGDNWYSVRGGFRFDWDRTKNDSFSFESHPYGGRVNQTYLTPVLTSPFVQSISDKVDVAGGNLLGHWTHKFSDVSNLKLQMFYDKASRQGTIFKEDRDIFDIDFQHRFPLGERHDIIWGSGYRVTSDNLGNSFTISFNPDREVINLFSAFIQDEVTLIRKRLNLTVGSKLEHNDYTGYEIQPSAQIVVTPHERHQIWASISRAARTPSRAEEDVRINQKTVPPGALFAGSQTGVISFFGNKNMKSEELVAYEAGYRVQPCDRMTFDAAVFYNVYSNLRSLEMRTSFLETSPTPAHIVVPFVVANQLNGHTYGGELAARFQILSWWRLQALYSNLQILLNTNRGSTDTTSETAENSSPTHQVSFRSLMDFTDRIELDCVLRYVNSVPGLGINSYIVSDVHIGWKLTKNIELSLVGQNLPVNHHPEFNSSFIARPAIEVPYSVYGKIAYRI